MLDIRKEVDPRLRVERQAVRIFLKAAPPLLCFGDLVQFQHWFSNP